MYLAKQVRTDLHKIRQHFTGTVPYSKIIEILTPVLKKYRAKPLLLLDNVDKNLCVVSGIFDTQTRRMPITIEITCSAKGTSVRQAKKYWENFLFDIFEILLHENLHLCQFSYRDTNEMSYFFELDDGEKMTEEQEYFAMQDEIEAYGLSIALEILYQFPKKNPFDVLRDLNKNGSITYDLYQKKFHGTKWSDIRQLLLKKIYRWLNDCVDNDWGFYSTNK